MCCEPCNSDESDIDGECPDCGAPTVDGQAAFGCAYSPTVCETCNYSPCDGSC